MKKLLLAALLFAGFTACEKDTLEQLEGHYAGTFTRTTGTSHENPVTSNVSLHLSSKEFSGSSTVPKYPAICSGTYEATSSTLQVRNTCVFTADFDWTLIFDGTYNYEVKGDSLRIWKDYPNGTRDLYLLKD